MNLDLQNYFIGQALQGLLSGKPDIPVEHLVLTSYHIGKKMFKYQIKFIRCITLW